MGVKDKTKDKGWVNVSVQTYQSQRNAGQRILQQDYTVDESGATLNALARNSDGRDHEQTEELTTGQGGSTSILLRDWKVRPVAARRWPPPAAGSAPTQTADRQPLSASRARSSPAGAPSSGTTGRTTISGSARSSTRTEP